jgi:hypothetical protein
MPDDGEGSGASFLMDLLVQDEAKELRAQLPLKPQEAPQGCNPRRERLPEKLGAAGFLQLDSTILGRARIRFASRLVPHKVG